jgi:glycosyltransferase involved in cell wall biosynthesis
MEEVYKNVYLLINPSKCYEGFGRTPCEAMAGGIPSIVSGIGGLPEVVSNSGEIVNNIFNIEEWLKKIKRFDNKDYYKKKSKICLDRRKILKKLNEIQYEYAVKKIETITKM